MNKEEIVNLFVNTKPAFTKSHHKIICGRVQLPATPQVESALAQSSLLYAVASLDRHRFVYTKSALSLLETVARCVQCNEPVLLCGETGVGKTSVLQHLAQLLGKPLSVLNLNQQTETSDLLGSFRPVDIATQMKLYRDRFRDLFARSFSTHENQTFLSHVDSCFLASNWTYLAKLMSHAASQSVEKFSGAKCKEWRHFKAGLERVEQSLGKCCFRFVEGKLTQAIQSGEWVLLDEINLASAETLQFLTMLLENTASASSSVVLYEKGDREPLVRHENFRLFGAMNPASDIGKRNLPSNIRARFTEIFVDELDNEADLSLLVRAYLGDELAASHQVWIALIHFDRYAKQ